MNTEQAKRIKARRAAVRQAILASPKYQAARVVFASPAGKQLLAELGTIFDADDLLGDSVEETFFNLGERALYRELVFLATAGEKKTGETHGET